MKNPSGFAVILRLLVVGVSVYQPSCYAQVQQSPHLFRVKARVEPNVVMVGEPLSVFVSFDPKTDNPVAISVGDHFQWCTFEIFKDDKVVSSWKQNVRDVGVMQRSLLRMVDVHQAGELSVMISPQFTSLPVGEYTLRLRTRIRCEENVKADRRLDTSSLKTVEEDSVDLPLSIKALEVEKMKERISKLYRAIGRETDVNLVRSMAYELAMLPPEQAKGAWRSLLLDKKIDPQKRYTIAQALSTQRTIPIAETLLFVQYTDPIRDENGQILTLRSMLNAMCSYGGEVEKYIRGEFHKHRNSPFHTPIIIDGVV